MRTHFINRCSCGAVISQCRCPGTKPETVVPGGCPTCKAMAERVAAREVIRAEQAAADWHAITEGHGYAPSDPPGGSAYKAKHFSSGYEVKADCGSGCWSHGKGGTDHSKSGVGLDTLKAHLEDFHGTTPEVDQAKASEAVRANQGQQDQTKGNRTAVEPAEQYTDDQRKLGASAAAAHAAGDAPAWVGDAGAWEQAKTGATKLLGADDSRFWTLAVALYQRAGGVVNAREAADGGVVTAGGPGSGRHKGSTTKERESLSEHADSASSVAEDKGTKQAHEDAKNRHIEAGAAYESHHEKTGSDQSRRMMKYHANEAAYHENAMDTAKASQSDDGTEVHAAHGETTGKPSFRTLMDRVQQAVQEDSRFDTDSHGYAEGSQEDLVREPRCVDVLVPDDDGKLSAVVATDDGRLVVAGFTWDGQDVKMDDGEPRPTEVTAVYAKAAADAGLVLAGDYPGHPFHGNQYGAGGGGGEHNEASRKANDASNAVRYKGKETTAHDHSVAAKAHARAAALQEKAGNDDTAAYHKSMAAYHDKAGEKLMAKHSEAARETRSAAAKTESAKSVGEHSTASEAHGEAAKANATGGSAAKAHAASQRAHVLSAEAHGGKGQSENAHGSAAKAHNEAAGKHTAAASEARGKGNTLSAGAHSRLADAHAKHSIEHTRMAGRTSFDHELKELAGEKKERKGHRASEQGRWETVKAAVETSVSTAAKGQHMNDKTISTVRASGGQYGKAAACAQTASANAHEATDEAHADGQPDAHAAAAKYHGDAADAHTEAADSAPDAATKKFHAAVADGHSAEAKMHKSLAKDEPADAREAGAAEVMAGDYPGHPFHGNQYGAGGGEESHNKASHAANEASNAVRSKGKEATAYDHSKAA